MSMRKIYRKIAKKHGVTVGEVKREMQKAIDLTYQKSDASEGEKGKQRSPPYQGEKPNPEEFIHYIAQEVKVRKN